MAIFEAFALAAPDAFELPAVTSTLGNIGAEEASKAAAAEAARQAALQAEEQAAQQATQQQATQQGITQAAQNSAMTPEQEAYLRASNASVGPGITQGTVPLTTAPTAGGITSASASSIPEGMSTNTGWAQQAGNVEPININPSGTAGNVISNGGLTQPMPPSSPLEKGWDTATTWMGQHPNYTAVGAYMAANRLGLFNQKPQTFNSEPYNGPLSRYHMTSDFKSRQADPSQYQYTPHYDTGGIASVGRNPVEQMSNQNSIGANTGFPQAYIHNNAFATPTQTPVSQNVLTGPGDTGVDPYTGEQKMAAGGIARYGSGGVFGEISNTVGDALAGVGQFANNLTQGRLSVGRPDTAQTAPDVARKYSTMTLAQNNVSPQQYQYSPQYNKGGVPRYYAGSTAKSNMDALNYYTGLMEGQAGQQIAAASNPIGGQGDAGIVRDQDPDTMYLSAPEAAAVRMGKINAKANMQGPTMPRPKPVGRINLKPQGVQQAAASGSSLDPEMAASGGIMGASHLGSYAAGGNPRLLKGPGDGMSDNIPAVIANKQPARLADGEFVIPADVVSHLGNGSTDAGAKKLHHMMDTVRKARTGNPKQGKQINPDKYLPK